MCGITGILNFNRQPVEQSQIKAMTDVIAHRGPDGEGQYIDGYMGLGHRRLAIIDLSLAGHQPMQTKDGRFTITYNGEIYNFEELRVELEASGYQFHSNTDTEVVLNAYAHWGIKCLTRFNGMFAFAIWDKDEKKLFLARDRYGIKPLYYHQTDRCFSFGSEIKSIIASGQYQARLDKEALVEYLTFQNFFSDRTLFQDVKMLMPGHYAIIRLDGNIEKQQYWDFKFCGSLKISEMEAIEETDRLFNQAVQRQLISDVPINAYLSGGIDSGSIAMIASQFLPHLQTFTIGFDLSSASGLELSFDERSKAERISYLAKTEHYEMVLKAGDMERCMEKYVWHLEEPRVGQSYPNYYAAKLASKFGKVVLSGVGGDELFGGYPWRYFHSEQSQTFDEFIDAYYLKWQRLISNSALKGLISPIFEDVQHVWTRDIFADVFKPLQKKTLNSSDWINYSLYLESKTFLHGLLVVEDKLSMAHGLETRVPFLDNDLVDFAVKLPDSLKIKSLPIMSTSLDANENDLIKKAAIRSTNGKYILRKALARYLDDEIINDRKQGFSSPDASWFRGESIDYVKDTLQKSALCSQGFFDFKSLNKIINEHLSGKHNHRLFIWSFLNLEKSYAQYFS
jgi:asparagine synthase (glutamine-hydrolysing)